MGLERTIGVLTGAKSVYETDLFTGIIGKIVELSARPMGRTTNTRSMRIIADHVRTATFIIGDDRGVTPSNVDQGYVLRRLIRRAVRHGMKIGLPTGATATIAEVIVGQYASVYPELERNRAHILEQFNLEEDRFQRTLKQGMREFDKVIAEIGRVTGAVDAFEAALKADPKAAAAALASKLRPTPENQPIIEALRADGADYAALAAKLRAQYGRIDGRSAFKLYDTYGFPIEITTEMAREKGLTVDVEGFEERSARPGKATPGASSASRVASPNHEETRTAHATHLLHARAHVLGRSGPEGLNITAERPAL